mmetsp:Transcript_41519/g.100843  ORF Transcript_41519/g.100843 Transcript_41519/m.100843 type:complete len:172 (+) Transcript_41519:158-673(+)
MPKMTERPTDMDTLSHLKFVSLTAGKRPATASISQEIRKHFGISNCCFRTSCSEDQACSFREQRWEEIGYKRKRDKDNPHLAKKRAREAEQATKMEQELQKLRELKAARRQKAMCLQHWNNADGCSNNAKENDDYHRPRTCLSTRKYESYTQLSCKFHCPFKLRCNANEHH